MKRYILLFNQVVINKSLFLVPLLTFLILKSACGQPFQFEQILPSPPHPQLIADFYAVSGGHTVFIDIDGDNDLDVFMTGNGNARLFKNNGNGNYYNETINSFEGYDAFAFDFADVDSDGDQDLLITLSTDYDHQYTKLYSNDGNGVFTEFSGSYFTGVRWGAIKFADIDNDSDQDVLILGETSDFQKTAKLYTNDGIGNFSEVIGTPFQGVCMATLDFADIDNDNDQDVFIIGDGISILYLNDGLGNFAENINTDFTGICNGSFDLSDIDNDNDLDILITGDSIHSGYYVKTAKLYLNQGNADFSEVIGTPFVKVNNSAIAFADIDADGDEDLLITGAFGNSYPWITSRLYLNNGDGSFVEDSTGFFKGVYISTVDFADVDNDNDLDVLLTGEEHGIQKTARLYQNAGDGSYDEVTGMSLKGVHHSSVCFVDTDGDSYKDVLINGEVSPNNLNGVLYKNNGIGIYYESTDTTFAGLINGSISSGDIDNDNDNDILVTGYIYPNVERVAKLYENDGYGNYAEIIGTPFIGVSYSSSAFADVDNDDDLDIIITGYGSNIPTAHLFLNDGNGNYNMSNNNSFEGVQMGSVSFTDYDNDNDIDVLLTGRNYEQEYTSTLYQNDGSGSFSIVAGTNFEGVFLSATDFADIDGDNDQDLFLMGYNGNECISKLYLNLGNGNFEEMLDSTFIGLCNGALAFIDADNDNDMDLVLTGGIPSTGNSYIGISKLYENDGYGNFIEILDIPFDGVSSSSIDCADIENDGDIDILISGWSEVTNKPISKIYRNLLISTGIPSDDLVTRTKVSIYPNPSQSNSFILYYIENNSYTTVDLFSITGKHIINIHEGTEDRGYKEVSVNIENLPPGMYLYRINIGKETITRKIVKL